MEISKMMNIVLAIGLIVALYFVYANKPSKTSVENEVIKTIHQRKSVREYTDQKVLQEQLIQLVKAGMAAPSALNSQPWDFVVVTDRNLLDSLAAKLPNAPMLANVSAAIVVCGNMEKTLEGAGLDFWIQDCSAATQNILLAAESMGLGAVWTGAYPTEKTGLIRDVLTLPSYIVPLNVIPIGYPTGKEQPKNKWKEENLHYNGW